MPNGAFRSWTIYKRPLDHPTKYVVRGWTNGADLSVPDRDAELADTLNEARDLVPGGLTRIPRAWQDDPIIVETWL